MIKTRVPCILTPEQIRENLETYFRSCIQVYKERKARMEAVNKMNECKCGANCLCDPCLCGWSNQ